MPAVEIGADVALGAGIALVLGLALGAGIAALLARSRRAEEARVADQQLAELRAKLEERSAQVARLETEIAEREHEHDEAQQQLRQLDIRRAALAQQLEDERRGNAEKLELLARAEEGLREAFQALSAEALHRNSQSFLDLAKTALGEHHQKAAGDLELRQKAIDALITPIRDSLGRVDEKLAQVEKERQGHYSTLAEQLRSVASAHQMLQSETQNLVKALRQPTVRGRWGEIQLRRVVELAGMLDHCDFHEQRCASDDDERRLRPDLVVRLPGGKNVVVDAKAALERYLAALEAPDDATREACLREHARQVRDHMTKLSSKSYWSQFQPAPEFVVMFLPGETFFGAALQHAPDLIEYGVEHGVIPASPTTLIALLRAVAYGWRQEALAANAQEISRRGRDLHERIATLVDHFEGVRKGLGAAVRAYNSAVGSLETRVLVAARRFKDLGADSGEEIRSLDTIEIVPRALQAAELGTGPAAGIPAQTAPGESPSDGVDGDR